MHTSSTRSRPLRLRLLQAACCAPLCAALLVGLAGCRPPQAAIEAARLLEQGRPEAAQTVIDRGLEQHPEEEQLWLLRFKAALAQDDRQAAVAAYQAKAKRDGQDEDLLRALALELMTWGLRARDPALRIAAIQAARRTDADELERPVAGRLQDPDAVVRTWAAVALSATPQGADTLAQQLRSPSPQARAIAVRQVARLARDAAFSDLIQFVEDPAPEVRAAAADALGLMQEKQDEVLPHLVRLLEDKERTVRAQAAAAIGALGRETGAAPVRRALDDPYLGVRLAAVLTLVKLGVPDARSTLQELAEGEDLLVALRAGLKLAELGAVQPALNAIARGLVDRRWEVRVAACNAASSLEDKVALRLVRKALSDPEPQVRLAAARAAAAHREHELAASVAARELGQACPTAARSLPCLRAAEILLKLGRPQGMAVLRSLVAKSPLAQVRREALAATMGAGADLSLALAAMADEEPEIGLEAAAWIYRRLEN